MATKAELEAELMQLRAELAARDSQAQERAEAVLPSSEARVPDEGDLGDAESHGVHADIAEILADLEELPHKQPLMFALGAFAVGYLIGRMK